MRVPKLLASNALRRLPQPPVLLGCKNFGCQARSRMNDNVRLFSVTGSTLPVLHNGLSSAS